MSGVMCATREKIQLESDYFILHTYYQTDVFLARNVCCATRHKNGRDDLGEARKKEENNTSCSFQFHFTVNVLPHTFIAFTKCVGPSNLQFISMEVADENEDNEDETYNEKWQRRMPKRNSNKIRTK